MKINDIENLTLSAKNGDANAQNLLGVYYATEGKSGKVDNALSLKWYLRASISGYSEALWNAGSMLIDGEDGVEKNESLGLLLIRIAADAFQTSACLYLSRCYELGRHGCPIELSLSNFWSRMGYTPEKFKSFSHAAELELLNIHPVVRKYAELPGEK